MQGTVKAKREVRNRHLCLLPPRRNLKIVLKDAEMDCSQYPLVAAYLFVAIMLKKNNFPATRINKKYKRRL